MGAPKRDSKGRFLPGQGGRPKGAVNKGSGEIKAACAKHGDDMVAALVGIAGDADHPQRIKAIELVLAYGFGKPRQALDQTVAVTRTTQESLGEVESEIREIMAKHGGLEN